MNIQIKAYRCADDGDLLVTVRIGEQFEAYMFGKMQAWTTQECMGLVHQIMHELLESPDRTPAYAPATQEEISAHGPHQLVYLAQLTIQE